MARCSRISNGTLTFTDNGTNTYSGGTDISANVVLGDGTANTGTLGSGTVTGDGTLIFNEPRAVTFANTIYGDTSDVIGVTVSGPGTVTFTDNGSNTYTDDTTINPGSTLVLGDGTTNTGTLGNGGGCRCQRHPGVQRTNSGHDQQPNPRP